MNKILLLILLLIIFSLAASGQTIRVNPTGVNVNSQNPTVVFLTFGQIPPGYVMAEGVWCGELIPAPLPALGLQCRPDTIYGSLPARYDLSRPSGNLGITDIMAIPPSVARRAYQEAETGGDAGFFYVRRFVSTTGGPDQYVNVTCRMTGGGARVPFALTNVEIKTERKEQILFLKPGEKFPKTVAEIQYNGTGRLKGRWEIVQPGEEPPGEEDLLTEATLPVEQRGTQRRYTEVARFNHFLPPVGKFTLPLETKRVPIVAEGQYILLLRIEATDDKEADSNLQAVGVGNGVVHSGAVAAFPLPGLKFFVGGRNKKTVWEKEGLLFPLESPSTGKANALLFGWKALEQAKFYRLEIVNNQEKRILSAVLPAPIANYRIPSWFQKNFSAEGLRWRVLALDNNGRNIARTNWQKFSFTH